MVDFHPYRSGRLPDAEMRKFPLAGLKLLTPSTRGARSQPTEGDAPGGTGSRLKGPEDVDSSK